MKEKKDVVLMDINEVMDVPKDYYVISQPKLEISAAIKKRLDEENMSIRELGERIGMKHPTIVQVTSVRSYKIETLLRILDGLDLELVVQPKKKHD